MLIDPYCFIYWLFHRHSNFVIRHSFRQRITFLKLDSDSLYPLRIVTDPTLTLISI